jgi:hypothetical protein
MVCPKYLSGKEQSLILVPGRGGGVPDFNDGLNRGLKLDKNEEAIVAAILEFPDITQESLAKKIGISLRSLE